MERHVGRHSQANHQDKCHYAYMNVQMEQRQENMGQSSLFIHKSKMQNTEKKKV